MTSQYHSATVLPDIADPRFEFQDGPHKEACPGPAARAGPGHELVTR